MSKVLTIIAICILIGCSSHLEQKQNIDYLFNILVERTSKNELIKEDSIAQSLVQYPYSPPTRFIIDIIKRDSLQCSLYNTNGVRVNKPLKMLVDKGMYCITLKRDTCPYGVSGSGAYFMRYQLGDSIVTRKILLMY